MKFVHVEDFIHPDAGYQVNLLSHLQKEQGHDVSIVTGEMEKIPLFLTEFFGTNDIEKKDQKFFERTGVKIYRVPLRGFYSGRAIFYKKKLFKVVEELKPDVVYIHGEDTLMGMQFIWNFNKFNFPIVLDCHMLEMASVNRLRNIFRFFFRTFITPKITKYNIPLIRVVDTDYVQKYYGIPLIKTAFLPLGTNTAFFKPDAERKNILRKMNNIEQDVFAILYAGKLDESKGGLFFAEAIKEKLIPHNRNDVIFIIIGNTVGNYGKEVEEKFSQSSNKIIRLPTQTYHNLLDFYQIADLSIFPRQCSLSFFEAQACGLPVIFEENEMNNQRSSFNNAFTFIPGDANDFREKIMNCVNMDMEQYAIIKQNSRKYVLDNYDYVTIAQKTTELMIDAHKAYHLSAK